jgi:hypothetical protein
MKCTDFWEKEKELKRTALCELAEAIKAHGGRYTWCDEDGDIPEGIEAPCVCVFMDYGPTDVIIKEIVHDEKGWWFSGETTDEYSSEITFDEPYDIADAYAIQTITQKVPETDEVKDATVPQSQVVSLLDQDDLKQRGFDGSKLTNEELAQIAAKMGNYYLDYGFWDDMEEACNYYEVPRLNKEETEE